MKRSYRRLTIENQFKAVSYLKGLFERDPKLNYDDVIIRLSTYLDKPITEHVIRRLSKIAGVKWCNRKRASTVVKTTKTISIATLNVIIVKQMSLLLTELNMAPIPEFTSLVKYIEDIMEKNGSKN